MIKSKRINQIKEYVFEHESVSLEELVEHFGVSKNTIRRDIQSLVDSGIIKKVYGGVSVNHSTLVVFNERRDQNLTKKQEIGKLASQFVEDGDVIFVDSGTTTLELLPYIQHRQLTIVTNNFDFIHEAKPFPSLSIFSTGGMLERKTNSFVGFQSIELLKKYNINKAFIASTGISITNGVTNSSPLETDLKSTVVEKSLNVYLMIDDSKFDKYALTTYCSLSDIDYLITNSIPNASYQQYALEHGIKIVTS
ncbi:DeoR/GlpR family DNA-binding transcription regulator [Paenibacillus kribbensis]|uniref:DeoR/GlpR family DNA-binding transcription regulator n=1 Tax=Paenibacillus kribbensis TaxID=172713 RepID=UPI002DBFEE65|nr:DeoR/GlpR family DNA-binding transcription regulator [Paenibacillus kribbensis]MEC0236660.1 DeoR/GlpR family DNA-binding transcription regulator [Paenibacillus kribbensis]